MCLGFFFTKFYIMEKTFLTDNEIDDVCLRLIENIKNKHPQYYNYVRFLYDYGCRVGELFDFRISFDAVHYKVLIQPQKKNNLRELQPANIHASEIIEHINITQNLFHLNKRNLQRIIEKEIHIHNLRCGNKKIGAHIFRHNWIKKKVAQGYQITSIDQMLGYTWQTVASTYSISRIYY